MGNDGIKCLAEGLKNTDVIHLDLEENEITGNEIKYLVEVFSRILENFGRATLLQCRLLHIIEII